ncbi:MAG: CoA transferase [Acidimicrobiales bacterium]|nr:CoA transferase [Acidimicrobiales bacterium]MDP6297884.1 CoA transferase [Acidimicrobiales bacterium]HJM28510.1 CoA transferase [Acidimicrobiales bacterium]HJM98319.1 CoA transferase [Acidimicrobiales bacterium]
MNYLQNPVATAHNHLTHLLECLPEGLIDKEDVIRLSEVRQQWPAWPTPLLSNLVGPPSVILKNLDLRWLHRFETTVLLLNQMSRMLGGPIGGPSGLSLIVERAPLLGHRGWGTTSAGGSCRLLEALDETIAVNLPREEDLLSVPAWLEQDYQDDIWELIKQQVAKTPALELIERAELLGMAVSAVGEAKNIENVIHGCNFDTRISANPVVADLSSMWAGPLCGWFLSRSGAEVLKVESSQRPDRGRVGRAPFYKRLNHGKKIIEVDFQSEKGVSRLRRIVREADIVIESSRPRALESLGLFAEEEVQRGAIWCSITGYGRERNPARIGFGDDAAAAGNLLASVGDDLWFIGDAVADPITGTTAAVLTQGLWLAGGSGFIDLSLSGSAHLHTLGKMPEGTI